MLALSAFLLVFGGFYYLYSFRPIVVSFLEGSAVPTWFSDTVHQLYPRFLVERHRFEPAFFLQKADMLVGRAWAIMSLLIAFLMAYQYFEKVRNKCEQFWEGEEPSTQAYFYTRFIYAGIFVFTYDWLADFEVWHRFAAFYRPHSFYQWFPLPSVAVLQAIWVIMLLSAGTVVWRPNSRFAFLASISFLFLHGFFNGFEKTDHGFATLGFVLLLLPFSSLMVPQKGQLLRWPFQLARVMVAAAYFLSGIEKLTIAGFKWLSPLNLHAHLLQHPTHLGALLSAYPALLFVGSLLILSWQLVFPLILFKEKWIVPLLCIGVAFHMATWVLMDVGTWLSPWVWVYVLFLKQNPFPKALFPKAIQTK